MTNRRIIAVSIEPRKLEQLDRYADLLHVSRSKAIAILIIAGTPPLDKYDIRDRDTLAELKVWAAHHGWEDETDDGD